MAFDAFQNDSQVFVIGNLNVENQQDRVSIHGDFDLTNDRLGLNAVGKILEVFHAIENQLKASQLAGELVDDVSKVGVEPSVSSETRDPFA